MGNARLLTMNGDGHTAYLNGSECIDNAIVTYIVNLDLPPAGTQCDQNVPFPLPAARVNAQPLTRAGAHRGYAGHLATPLAIGR